MGVFEGVGLFVVGAGFGVADAADGEADLLATGVAMVHYFVYIRQNKYY